MNVCCRIGKRLYVFNESVALIRFDGWMGEGKEGYENTTWHDEHMCESGKYKTTIIITRTRGRMSEQNTCHVDLEHMLHL